MSKNNRAATLILYAETCLFTSVLLCILLLPEGLVANDGISYYSGYLRTIIPYSLGLLGAGWFMIEAARVLHTAKRLTKFTHWTMAIAVLILIVVAIPYAFNDMFKLLHSALSGALFLVQFAMAFWLYFVARRDLFNKILLWSLFFAIMLTVSYLSPRTGYLIAGEILFQGIFGVMLYRSVKDPNAKPGVMHAFPGNKD